MNPGMATLETGTTTALGYHCTVLPLTRRCWNLLYTCKMKYAFKATGDKVSLLGEVNESLCDLAGNSM
jgi:hypothetical protein